VAGVTAPKPSKPSVLASNTEKQSKRKATPERKKQLESIADRPAVPPHRGHCEFCGDGPEQFKYCLQ